MVMGTARRLNLALVVHPSIRSAQDLLKKLYADPGAMKLLLEIIAESNPKERNVNLASLIDSSFVERLDREGVFDR